MPKQNKTPETSLTIPETEIVPPILLADIRSLIDDTRVRAGCD